MRLTEELMLLLLNEQSGYLEVGTGWNFSCVVAGSVLAELALENRIDTDLRELLLIDATPTGDKLLDPALKEISESKETFDTQYWIERNTARSEAIVTLTFQRLVDTGILDHDAGGFWSLSRKVARSRTYRSSDGTVREEARARVLNVILNDVIPDPRDVILINLAHTCGVFKLILSPEDYEERLERIETLGKLDLIGRTVSQAIVHSTAKPKTRQIFRARPIPKLGFSDLLREKAFRTGNIAEGMCHIHEKHGPVVEAPFTMRKQRVIALIGPKTNTWVNKEGRYYLRSKDYIAEFEAAFGASRTLPGLDGADHYKMRKKLRPAYSRAALERRMSELIGLCGDSIAKWKAGDVLAATRTCQNHISSQVSHLSLGIDCSDYIDDLLAYQHRALIAHVQRAIPKFMLSTPRMRRAKKRIQEMLEAIHSSHTPAQRAGKAPDLADALLELHYTEPQFLPETDLTFPLVASMVASIYLGSSLAFAIYLMIANPDVYAGVRREAESIFGNGREPGVDDFLAENIPFTHGLFVENQRLYPVIPWQLRTVMNQCVVEGFEIPANSMLLVCQTASHYMGDMFEDPLKLDVDRNQPDRKEYLKPGAFAPYGLGTHACLGQRWVELQMSVNLLMIANRFSLELTPENYQLRINPFPTCAPGKRMKLRVAEVRDAA